MSEMSVKIAVILSKIIFAYINSHAHVQYAYNICTKFQIDCLKSVVGVGYTNLLPEVKGNHKIVSVEKCCNLVKNYFFSCEKSHAHVKCACNICATLQIDCLKTLRRVDYTNLLPNIEAQPQNCLSSKRRNIFQELFFLLKKSHTHMFNMLVTYVQSFKSIA